MENKYIKWISIDDLIKMLEEEKAELGGDGTVPVCINGISSIWLDRLPYYYDGGYCAIDVKDETNVMHSRSGHGMSIGFHQTRIDLRALDDDEDLKVEGRPVVEIDPDNWNWYIDRQQKERTQFDGQLVQYKLLKEKNEEMGCYPFKAFLDSGESALGRNIAEAKKALLEKYKKKV